MGTRTDRVSLRVACDVRGRVAAGRAALLLLALVALSLPAAANADGGVPGVPSRDAAALASGKDFACVIVDDGTLRCWGDNSAGQLAQGNTANIGDNPGESTVAVDLGPGRTAIAIATGRRHACAIVDTGIVRCWGDNSVGQLAQGNTANIGDNPGETTVAVDLGPGRTAKAIEAGGSFTCATLDNGTLRCWGSGTNGALAQGNVANIGDNPGETTVAIDLGPGRTATAVGLGRAHGCVIVDTGALRCWGANPAGELGLGSNAPAIGDFPGETPALVGLGVGRTARSVSAGDNHTCAILDDGTLRCWGFGGLGALGQGNPDTVGLATGLTTVGVTLGAGRTAVAVSAGANHTCAILDDGTLRCWGLNAYGTLGQGNTTVIGDSAGETTVGVDIGPGRSAIAVAGGDDHTCVSLDDRSAKCWGRNTLGALGQGSAISYGGNAGERPFDLPPIQLGGRLVGRDTDGDGIRDAADACPTVAGTLANGCPAPTVPTPVPPTPAPTTAPSPTPAPTTAPPATQTPVPLAEASRTGKRVAIDALLRRASSAKRCPKTAVANVVVPKGTSRKSKTAVLGTARLKVVQVTTSGRTRCRATGTLRLNRVPPADATVRIVVNGKGLTARTLTARAAGA